LVMVNGQWSMVSWPLDLVAQCHYNCSIITRS
jgi:hypothetical protein